MAKPVVTRINPDLIPHSDFHKGIWLLSEERPSWYYFKKKKNKNSICNKAFSSSVDEPLKELVAALHKNGIKTTPSCSGHDMKERNLAKFYDDMKADATSIKNEGLMLKDIESGARYFCRDADYTLPWNKKEFVKELSSYQHTGVIGLRTGHRRKLKQELLGLQIPGVRITACDGIVFIFTNENNDSDIGHTWKLITRAILALLK